MAGEVQPPLFVITTAFELGSSDSARLEAATRLAAEIMSGEVVELLTCSSIASMLGLTRQAVSQRHRTGTMPEAYLRTDGGSPLWLPFQTEELVRRHNAVRGARKV